MVETYVFKDDEKKRDKKKSMPEYRSFILVIIIATHTFKDDPELSNCIFSKNTIFYKIVKEQFKHPPFCFRLF